MAKKSIVGDVINYEGMVYGPVNEMGVVALFAKVCEKLGFIIEEVRAEFPDCTARRQVERGWECVLIEFEFKSKNFYRHGHDPESCDLIICWVNDWPEATVPVLALKPYIEKHQASLSAPLERVRIAEPVELRISELTQGAINNGYINIKPLDDFWPCECVGGNVDTAEKHLIVEFEGVGRITTDISGRHKTFRGAHSQIKAFFEKHDLSAGDSIQIIRVGQYEYKLRPTKAT